jgi:succinyl-CoA synthetase beta subunit
MDIIQMFGGSPANFDIGGGASKETALSVSYFAINPKVKGFGKYIWRYECDVVASGIVEAAELEMSSTCG